MVLMNFFFLKKKPILTKLNLAVEKIEPYDPSDLLPPSGII